MAQWLTDMGGWTQPYLIAVKEKQIGNLKMNFLKISYCLCYVAIKEPSLYNHIHVQLHWQLVHVC